MKRTAIFLSALALSAPLALAAQSLSPDESRISSSYTPAALLVADPAPEGAAGQVASPLGVSMHSTSSEGPLTRIAMGAGISPLGIELQAATNLTGHLSARVTGNIFNYSTNFTTQGINATGKLNLSSVRASLDVYPFRSGFRISPGILLKNANQVTATTDVAAGTSFTLNDQTYYSANANAATGATPVTGNGVLGLNTNNPAFAITAGWGNLAHGKGHWSVPVEAGVAFIGDPTVKVNLTGWACYDQAQTECTNISDPTNPIAIAIQSNLTAQIAKWTKDLQPLNTYPIVSVGVAYSFHIR
jgi:hypothetical protein